MVFILEIFPLFARVLVAELVEVGLVIARLNLLIVFLEAALLVAFVLVEEGAFLGAAPPHTFGALLSARGAAKLLVALCVLFAALLGLFREAAFVFGEIRSKVRNENEIS